MSIYLAGWEETGSFGFQHLICALAKPNVPVCAVGFRMKHNAQIYECRLFFH